MRQLTISDSVQIEKEIESLIEEMKNIPASYEPNFTDNMKDYLMGVVDGIDSISRKYLEIDAVDLIK